MICYKNVQFQLYKILWYKNGSEDDKGLQARLVEAVVKTVEEEEVEEVEEVRM